MFCLDAYLGCDIIQSTSVGSKYFERVYINIDTIISRTSVSICEGAETSSMAGMLFTTWQKFQNRQQHRQQLQQLFYFER
jgi:hypothetical protein